MLLIEKIKSAQSRVELRNELSYSPVNERHELLTNAINSLNEEIESDIALNNLEIAIFKMSQVVMFEDELHVLERVMLRTVLSR